ncbi:hypothetical protein [Asticcacaulis sp. W401b]
MDWFLSHLTSETYDWSKAPDGKSDEDDRTQEVRPDGQAGDDQGW